MQLQVTVTQDELVQALREFLPVKIDLDSGADEERWLALCPASAVEIVPQEGLRATCAAELKWAIAGIAPTLKLDELRVMFRPRVTAKDGEQSLEVDVEVEIADFRALPEFIDATIVKTINASLAKRKPSWNFGKTMTRTVGLGRSFHPLTALDVQVLGGQQQARAEEFTLEVFLKVGFVRQA